MRNLHSRFTVIVLTYRKISRPFFCGKFNVEYFLFQTFFFKRTRSEWIIENRFSGQTSGLLGLKQQSDFAYIQQDALSAFSRKQTFSQN